MKDTDHHTESHLPKTPEEAAEFFDDLFSQKAVAALAKQQTAEALRTECLRAYLEHCKDYEAFNELYPKEKARTAIDGYCTRLANAQGGKASTASAASPENAFNPFLRLTAPAFRADCWPEVVGTFAQERQEATGADANGFACAAVQAMSMAIHPLSKLEMQPGGDWLVPPVLWFGLVGPSGTNKSAIVAENRKHAHAREKREKQRFAAAMQGLKQQFTDEKALAQEAAKIAPIRALAPDGTVEALQQILARAAQKGWSLNVVTDELLRHLEAIDKYGPSRHHWLTGHDCVENHNVDRIERGSITVPVWALGLFGGIQPDALRASRLKPQTDGLLQRIILCVLQPAGLPGYGPLEGPKTSTPARDAISARIAKTYERNTPSRFDLSIDAHYIRHAFLKDNLMIQNGLGEDPLAGFISKQRGVWGRVAMAFHLLEGGVAGQQISKDTAIRALLFMTQFAYRHAGAVYDDMTGGEARSDLAYAAGWLLNRQHAADGAAIEITSGQMSAGPRALRAGSVNRERTLDALEAGGWLWDLSAMPKSGVLKSRRWRMTPGLSTRFAAEFAAYLANVALARARVVGG